MEFLPTRDTTVGTDPNRSSDKSKSRFFPSVFLLHKPTPSHRHPSLTQQHVANASPKRVTATTTSSCHHFKPIPAPPTACYASRPYAPRRKIPQSSQRASDVTAAMSEETPTNAPVDAQAVSTHVDTPMAASPVLRLPQPAAEAEPTTSPKPEGEAPIAKEDEETAGKPATTEATAPDGEQPAEVAEGPSEPAADATPSTNGKDKKRKSVSGVPEHKGKKLNKKKSMPNLQLDCKPGDYYWARLKGYPPWPAIICDEDMLPESLLASRPVSTMRADGSLRDDFKEGGKNAKERTFPVMFLATNEL